MYNVYFKNSSVYPSSLYELKDPPNQLYLKGNQEILHSKSVAIVGSRRMSSYGKRITRSIVSVLASNDIIVVSGFMYGIDATAHEAAIEFGGKTIAVMPCGINVINPPNQSLLYQNIIDSGGLILTEYSPDQQPQLWTYPKRNRIVAALSKATIVVEAAEKSGSLITANYTRALGKRVFAVPGNIGASNSVGTNDLISKGCYILSDPNNILEHLGVYNDSPLFRDSAPNNNIVSLLSVEPLGFDELVEKTGIGIEQLSVEITNLSIQSLIQEIGGKYHVN